MRAAAEVHTAATGVSVHVEGTPASDGSNASTITSAFARVQLGLGPAQSSDGYVLPAEGLAALASLGLAATLGRLLSSSPALQLYNIASVYRTSATRNRGVPYGVPLGGAGMLLFYRNDLFKRLGLDVPNTWDELLGLAEQQDGLDVDGDGAADHSFCMPRGGGEASRHVHVLCALSCAASAMLAVQWGRHTHEFLAPALVGSE